MRNIEAASHVRGQSLYIDDMPRPVGMLFAALFTSPVAHGAIKSLNFDDARKLAGVKVILTAADIPGENQIGPIIQDEPLLAEDEVHFIGQPIAIIVAEKPETARKAARLITIEIEEKPGIFCPREAFAKGEIIGVPRTFQLGDIDSAWAECDVIVEGSCEMLGQEHVYLETQRARAIPLEGENMRIFSSTQSPYATQKTITKILGWSMHQLEVDVKRLGGAFGGKEDQASPYAAMAAMAAYHVRQPVELVLSRTEDMQMTGKRHPYQSDFKLGLSKDGQMLAYEASYFQNSGAAADLSTAILERTLFHSTNSYYVPNVKVFAAACRTNLHPHTAFRGFGGPQAMFVMESAITKASEVLGLPREEIQRKNLLQDGDMFPYGQRVENGRAIRTWDELADKYQLSSIRQSIVEFNASNDTIKKGFALMPICFGISFTSTFMNQAGALVHVYTDGSVSVTTGGIEMGQGLNTNMAYIAARTFGIDPARIKVEATNTTRVANMSPTAASSGTHLNGSAVMVAIDQILDRLKTMMAGVIGVPDPDLFAFADEKLYYDGSDTGYDWTEVVQKAYLSRQDLSAHGYFATPNIFFDRGREKGRPFAYHVYGTALLEVSVDCLRGTYDIDAVKIVHDLGRPLNKEVDRGQVEGGLAQGLGWMTLEDLQYDDKGRLLANALATYKVPDVFFMPDDVQVTFLENADEPQGPYGNKAVGEPPFMYGIGVFFALRQAMQAFDPRIKLDFHAPLTPERVLLGLYGDNLSPNLSNK